MSEWANQLDEAERLAAEGNTSTAFARAFGALEACYATASGLESEKHISFSRCYDALKAAGRITAEEHDVAKHLGGARNLNLHKYGFEPSGAEVNRCIHRIRRLCGKFAKTVQDVMIKPVITAFITDPIEKYIAIMDDEGISNIPIVNADGVAIGTLNEKAIIRAILASGGSPDMTRPVGQIDIRPVLRDVAASATLEKAAILLRECEDSALLVLAEGRPIGIITAYDLIH